MAVDCYMLEDLDAGCFVDHWWGATCSQGSSPGGQNLVHFDLLLPKALLSPP